MTHSPPAPAHRQSRLPAVPAESPSNKKADHNVRTKLADATGYPRSRRPIPPQWAHLVRPVNLTEHK